MFCLHNSFLFSVHFSLNTCFANVRVMRNKFASLRDYFSLSDPGVRMTISGGSIQHFLVGQGVSLVCRVQGPGLTSPPLALYWERGNKVSDTESERRNVTNNPLKVLIETPDIDSIVLEY